MNVADPHLDLDLDLARARDLGHSLGRALVAARDGARDSMLAWEWAGGRDFARDRVRGLDHAIDCAFHLARARDLGHARRLALDLAIAFDGVLCLGLDRALDLNFARGEHTVRELADDLSHALAAARGQPKAKKGAAAGLLAAAVRVLPAADRARYADEYRSELRELAQSGAGRWRQLGYALRQLRCAPQMRFALRSPRRRSAAL